MMQDIGMDAATVEAFEALPFLRQCRIMLLGRDSRINAESAFNCRPKRLVTHRLCLCFLISCQCFLYAHIRSDATFTSGNFTQRQVQSFVRRLVGGDLV